MSARTEAALGREELATVIYSHLHHLMRVNGHAAQDAYEGLASAILLRLHSPVDHVGDANEMVTVEGKEGLSVSQVNAELLAVAERVLAFEGRFGTMPPTILSDLRTAILHAKGEVS